MIWKFALGRQAAVVRILNDRIERFALRFLGFKIMETFAHTPAVISSLYNQIDLFPFVLADIPGPQVACFPIETHAPNIAQAVCPNLRPEAFRVGVEWVGVGIALLILADKRIVLWDAVGKLPRSGINIQAEDFAK